MISSNTRASRSASRFSSPAHPATGRDANKSLEASRSSVNLEASRAFLQKWLEPPVQSKPSSEEAGLMRYGVLESMAPLGALPKAKKATADMAQPVRKIILKTPGMAAAKAAADKQETVARVDGDGEIPVMTMSPPASPLLAPAQTSKRKSLAAKIRAEEVEDDEYDPEAVNGRRRSRRVSLPTKKSTPAALPATTQQSSPHQRRRSSTSITLISTTPKRQTRPETDQQGTTGKVVDAAVGEALKHYRYPTAWALRTLYDEKHGDAEFIAMIEDVFSQTADKGTIKEFFRQIEKRNREGKKDNRAGYYFVPPTTNSRFTPHKPMAAPYSDLIHEPETLARETTVKRAAKRIKVSHATVAEPEGTVADPDADPDMASTATTAMTRTEASATPPRRRGADGDAGHSKGMIEVKTPRSRKRARRDSGSSDSSLSTALSLSSPELRAGSLNSPTAHRGAGAGAGTGAAAREGVAGAAAAETAAAAAAAAATSAAATSAAEATPRAARRAAASLHSLSAKSAGAKSQTAPEPPQPITTRGKSVASSKQTVSNSSRPNSPTPQQHASRSRTLKHCSAASLADDASMPGRVPAAELLPSLKTRSAEQPPLSSSNGAGQAPMSKEDEHLCWDRRRMDARKVTNGVRAKESSVRGADAEGETTPARTTRRTRQSLAASVTARATRSASKRPNYEADRHDSPIAFPATGDGSSSVGSRACTPPTALRPAKRQKTGLRVKSSPVKKKGGTAAGVPRPVNEANSAASSGNSAKDATAENDENCSACGNTGDVVCCDGCPRSFHFECVDMAQSDHLPDEWYCNECLIRRYPSRVPVHRGIFGSALNNLEKSIPRAFSLPKRVQNRFEGVKAGVDGDYEELASNKAAKRRSGYDELPDFFKQREDGQAVLCHGCQRSATEIRAIIPCSVCSYHWHIDCLDPPLAVPPVLKTWRCPAHVDDVLMDVPALAPAHRFRRVKASQPISPAISRGLRNNGHIEIDWDGEPEQPERSGWTDVGSFGRTYKLSARGLILDFIQQLRNKGAGYGHRQSESKVIPYPSPLCQPESAGNLRGSAFQRKVEEMQVSLNLVSLRQKPSDGIEQLTSALLAAADQNVLSLMARTNADNIALNQLSDTDRLGLRATLTQMEAMSTRIRRVLGEEGRAAAPCTPPLTAIKAEVSSPVTESNGISDLHHGKMDRLPLVTEPTPPLTVDHGEGSMDLD